MSNRRMLVVLLLSAVSIGMLVACSAPVGGPSQPNDTFGSTAEKEFARVWSADSSALKDVQTQGDMNLGVPGGEVAQVKAVPAGEADALLARHPNLAGGYAKVPSESRALLAVTWKEVGTTDPVTYFVLGKLQGRWYLTLDAYGGEMSWLDN